MPLPGIELKFESLTDPDVDAAPGEPGELCIRGPNVMKGCWKNDAATAKSMTKDGFFRSGDVAKMDADGFVFIVDRTKDMLLCRGFNVDPRVIEEAIYEHASVEEVWVDDEDVDLEYHVRHVILPRPGTLEQLEKYVARLHSSLLDRSRPLWEIYVIEGLNTGQVAIYNKMHHSAIDGQAGVAITKALLSGSLVPPPIKPPRPRPRTNQFQLGVAELAGAAVSNALTQYVKLFKSLPAVGRAIASVSTRAPRPMASAT